MSENDSAPDATPRLSWHSLREPSVLLPFAGGSASLLFAICGLFFVPLPLPNRLLFMAGCIAAGVVVVSAISHGIHVQHKGELIRQAAQERADAARARCNETKAQCEQAAWVLQNVSAAQDHASIPQAHQEAQRARVAADNAALEARIAHDVARYKFLSTRQESVPATLIMNIVVFIVSGLVVVSFWTAGNAASWSASILWCVATLILGGLAGFLFGIPRYRTQGKTPVTRGVAPPRLIPAPMAPPLAPQPPAPAPPVASSPRDSGTSAAGSDPFASAPVPSSAPTAAAPFAVAQSLISSMASEPDRPPSTSTNDESPIEQMADWLTKTLVGVALVNLKELPDELHHLAQYVARCIIPPTSAAFGPSDAFDKGPVPSFALALLIYFTIVGFVSGYLLTQIFLQDYVNRHT